VSHLPGTLRIYITFSRSFELPAGLADTGDLALVGQLTEADTAYAVVAQVSMGTAADLAAVVAAALENLGSACCFRIIDFLAIT